MKNSNNAKILKRTGATVKVDNFEISKLKYQLQKGGKRLIFKRYAENNKILDKHGQRIKVPRLIKNVLPKWWAYSRLAKKRIPVQEDWLKENFTAGFLEQVSQAGTTNSTVLTELF